MTTNERRLHDMQELLKSHEREFKQAKEHANNEYNRLSETRNQLEYVIEGLNSNLTELRSTLSGAENRISTLETQLTQNETIRRDLEYKLGCIHSSLRRLIGYNQNTQQNKKFKNNKRRLSQSPLKHKRYSQSSNSICRFTSPNKGIYLLTVLKFLVFIKKHFFTFLLIK